MENEKLLHWKLLKDICWRCVQDALETKKIFTWDEFKYAANKSISEKSISDESGTNQRCIN